MSAIPLFECDLCKGEHRPSQRWEDNANGGSISVKRDGINGGYKWEHLCPACRNSLCAAIEQVVAARTP
jgi:hypothetical protein